MKKTHCFKDRLLLITSNHQLLEVSKDIADIFTDMAIKYMYRNLNFVPVTSAVTSLAPNRCRKFCRLCKMQEEGHNVQMQKELKI